MSELKAVQIIYTGARLGFTFLKILTLYMICLKKGNRNQPAWNYRGKTNFPEFPDNFEDFPDFPRFTKPIFLVNIVCLPYV